MLRKVLHVVDRLLGHQGDFLYISDESSLSYHARTFSEKMVSIFHGRKSTDQLVFNVGCEYRDDYIALKKQFSGESGDIRLFDATIEGFIVSCENQRSYIEFMRGVESKQAGFIKSSSKNFICNLVSSLDTSKLSDVDYWRSEGMRFRNDYYHLKDKCLSVVSENEFEERLEKYISDYMRSLELHFWDNFFDYFKEEKEEES
jgi:hypothetical protein